MTLTGALVVILYLRPSEKTLRMKILVCVSKTPDTTAKIAFKDNGTAFDGSGVTFTMNPYDEWYALVRALELKEQFGGTVTVINVGTPEDDVIIRRKVRSVRLALPVLI